MIYYKDLPDEVASTFLKEIDFKQVPYRPGFSFTIIDNDDCLTSAGKQWFKDRNIIIFDKSLLFQSTADTEHPVHNDGDHIDAAFNFVLNRQGELQFLGDVEGDLSIQDKVEDGRKFSFDRYRNVTKMTIVDRWQGHAGVVRIGEAHRTVTSSEPRFCLSIRIRTSSPVTKFDDLIKLF